MTVNSVAPWDARTFAHTMMTESRIWIQDEHLKYKLERLERLRSEDTPRRLMITHSIESN